VVAGIDPSGGSAPWGLAKLRKLSRHIWGVEVALEIEPHSVFKEIPVILKEASIACIDAPVGLVEERAFRPQERAALRLGAKLLPLTMPGMARLMKTGVVLAMLLSEAGVPVLETHPGSIKSGMELDEECMGLGRHSVDAVIAGIACALYCENKAVSICSRQGCIVLAFRKPLLVRGGKRFRCLAVI
jgi:predicted nuclease with RNAse H fold